MKKKLVIVLSAALLSSVLAGGNSVYAAKKKTNAYNEVIKMYITGIQQGWDQETWRNHECSYLLGYENSLDRIGYYAADLDEDDVPELMIGYISEDGSSDGMFIDLYTLADGKPYHVTESGERDRYYLCEDRTIANEGSSGAANSFFAYYQYGHSELTLKEAVIYDGIYDEQHPWFYSQTARYEDYQNPISEAEAQDIRNSYIYKNVKYKPLSGVKMGNGQSEGAPDSSKAVSERLKNTVEASDRLKDSIKAGGSDADLTFYYGQLYQLWDDKLNDFWGELKNILGSEAMDHLTKEEVAWIHEKEDLLSKYGPVYDDGSLENLEQLKIASEWTEVRVFELLKYFNE